MKTPQPPRGMRDALPEDCRLRAELLGRIRAVYESYGYPPIDTPAMENLETLTNKGGQENEKLMFKILKRGDKLLKSGLDEPADMALRFDLTVPLCRFYASNRANLPAVFRRHHIGPVWRAERPQQGRFREFYQCDLDIIGEASHLAECEAILAVSSALRATGLKNFTVRISDRRLLPAVFQRLGMTAEQADRAMISVDKLDKVGLDGVMGEMAEWLPGEVEGKVRAFMAELEKETPFEAALESSGVKAAQDELIGGVLENLDAIGEIVKSASNGETATKFWPTLARGMGYYTGPVYEIWDDKHPFALGGGGRYDNIIGIFSGVDAPACGCSIGFERLLVIVKEEGLLDLPGSCAKALVAALDDDLVADAFAAAERLRASGIPVETQLGPAKMKKLVKHAESVGISRLVLVKRTADGHGMELELRNLSDREARPAVATLDEIVQALKNQS